MFFFTLKIRMKEFCFICAQGTEQHKPVQSVYKPYFPMTLYQTLYAQLSILSAIMNMVYFYPGFSLLLSKEAFPLPPLPISAPSLLFTIQQLNTASET